MPIAHVSMKSGKSDRYRQSILDGIYEALRQTMDIPEGDQFMTISEHSDANFRYGAAFGIERSDDLIYIQITVFNTRPMEQKAALYRVLADVLAQSPGIRREDIFINLYDTPKENWSIGMGEMQFAPGKPSHA